MKKLFYVLLTAMLLGACATVPKDLRFEQHQVKEKLVKLKIAHFTELSMSEEQFFKNAGLTIGKPATDEGSEILSGQLLKEQEFDEKLRKFDHLQYIENSIKNNLFGSSINYLREEENGYLVFMIDRAYKKVNPDLVAGVIANWFTYGIPTLLGVPWCSRDYYYRVFVHIFDFDGNLVKTYLQSCSYKQIQGLYYGFEDAGIHVINKLMNSLYKQIEPDIPALNKHLISQK